MNMANVINGKKCTNNMDDLKISHAEKGA